MGFGVWGLGVQFQNTLFMMRDTTLNALSRAFCISLAWSAHVANAAASCNDFRREMTLRTVSRERWISITCCVRVMIDVVGYMLCGLILSG